MFTKLTLCDIERVRLILRGGTVIDWRRLNVSSRNDCIELLRVNEFNPEDESDALFLSEIQHRAIDYIERNLGFKFVADIITAPCTSDLMLLAAGRDRVLRSQACMVLKIMHVINHIEACTFRSTISISDHELFRLVEKKATGVIREMKKLGFPILEYLISRKTVDSLITKILGKKQTISADIFDKVRLRIVTASVNDIIPVVSYMSRRLFPFNYIKAGESHNSIFDFPDFAKHDPTIKTMVPKFQVGLKFENEMRPPANPNTIETFRTINFVVDLPIRINKRRLQSWSSGSPVSPHIVHIPTEFQIVDQISHARNEYGEGSHEKYEARRMTNVRERLLHGRRSWRVRNGI